MGLLTDFTSIMIPVYIYIYMYIYIYKVTFKRRLMLIYYVCFVMFLIHKTSITTWYIHLYPSRWKIHNCLCSPLLPSLPMCRLCVYRKPSISWWRQLSSGRTCNFDDVTYHEIRLNHKYPQDMKLDDKIYRRLIPLYPCVVTHCLLFCYLCN